jgi:hypothetical protein
MKSGFGGFNNLSPASGKSIAIDSYGTLQNAITSILGDNTTTQIFTTLVPSTIFAESDLAVGRWDPLYSTYSSSHLTQSVQASKPALSFANSLGKHPGVRGIAQRLQQATDAGSNAIYRTFLLYYRLSAVSTENPMFQHTYTQSGLSQFNPSINPFNTSIYRFTFLFNVSFGNKEARINGNNTTIMYGATTANTFRASELYVDTTNRTASFAWYNSNKSLLTPSSLASTGVQSTNQSSFTFTSASLSTPNSQWDAIYPSGSQPAKITLMGNLAGNDTTYHTVICVDKQLSAAQIQSIKTVLDKAYGA